MHPVRDASFWKVVREREAEQREADLERIRRGELREESKSHPGRRGLPKGTRERVRTLLADGKSVARAAELAGCSNSVAGKELAVLPPELRTARARAKARAEHELAGRVRALAEEGLTRHVIAERLQVSRLVVNRALKEGKGTA